MTRAARAVLCICALWCSASLLVHAVSLGSDASTDSSLAPGSSDGAALLELQAKDNMKSDSFKVARALAVTLSRKLWEHWKQLREGVFDDGTDDVRHPFKSSLVKRGEDKKVGKQDVEGAMNPNEEPDMDAPKQGEKIDKPKETKPQNVPDVGEKANDAPIKDPQDIDQSGAFEALNIDNAHHVHAFFSVRISLLISTQNSCRSVHTESSLTLCYRI